VIRGLLSVVLCIVAGTVGANEGGAPDVETTVTRILVTFADPGMDKAARAGPARPGYTRRSSAYLASVGVTRAAKRIASELSLVTHDEWPIRSLNVHCVLFDAPAGMPLEELLLQLRARPEVESAQLLNEFEVSAVGVDGAADPYAELQHHLVTLGLGQAHRWSRGDGVRVTVIDTGADLEHPELQARIESHRDFVDDVSPDFSADAHGTAVAGVIGAEANNGIGIVGVAPAARLTILKACWHRQNSGAQAVCNSFTIAKALDHAIQSGTDIINLSLSGPSDALLGRLVRQALSLGVVVVAAAPDQGGSGFPSDVAGVIVVASSEGMDPRTAARRTAVRAPGEDILVPVPRGGYDFASGSSLSAAQVSGVVALLVARRHDLTVEQISSLLLDSRVANSETVNACRALAELLGESGCEDGGDEPSSH
jgi:hypothetical protein